MSNCIDIKDKQNLFNKPMKKLLIINISYINIIQLLKYYLIILLDGSLLFNLLI